MFNATLSLQYGKIVNEHYPLDPEGKTKGYTFLEFSSHGSAVEAAKATNNYKLDKLHTFEVNMFSDFEKFENIPNEWEPPTEEAYASQGNRKSHLLEPDAYDQFGLVYEGGEKVSIFIGSLPDPVEKETRPRWTETYIKWSPMGSYLATFHDKGIVLWGGDDFRRISKFSHQGVQFIDFSPSEKYLVTFSPVVDRSAEEQLAIIIWETRTGVKKRAFHAEMPLTWPVFKWSHNDAYFGRMAADGSLSIYETPSFGLLDKKSIKVAGMRDFTWSPAENILGKFSQKIDVSHLPFLAGQSFIELSHIWTIFVQKSYDHIQSFLVSKLFHIMVTVSKKFQIASNQLVGGRTGPGFKLLRFYGR